MRQKIISAIDIRADKVICLIAQELQILDRGKILQLIGIGTSKMPIDCLKPLSLDKKNITRHVEKAISEAESESGYKIKNTYVSISENMKSEYIDYENITLAPSKGNITRNIDPDSLPFEYNSTYNQNKFFPEKIVDLEMPYILREFRGQSVVFYPFQYNPVQNLLRVYNKIEVEIYSLGISQTNVLDDEKTFDKSSKEYANIYENHFLNFSFNESRFDYLVDHGNMLVISYSSFIETVQPLVDWKNRKGIPSEIVNVSDIGTSSSSITSYVQNYYNENGLTFLLLVGDIAQIPSPTVSGSASDVSYGCILGNDFYPEVIVGRLSGSTPNQIATQVERSINYERSPQSGAGWYDNAMGVASTQGPGFGGYTDAQFNDFLWDTVLSDFTYDSYQYSYDGSGSVSLGMEIINNGVSIINYTGHGSISSWGNGAPLSTSNVNSLTNNNFILSQIS